MKNLIVLILSLILCGCSIFKSEKHFTLKIYDERIVINPHFKPNISPYYDYSNAIFFETELVKADGSVIKSEDRGFGFFTKDFNGTTLKVKARGYNFTVEVWKEGEMIDKEVFEGYKKTEREYR